MQSALLVTAFAATAWAQFPGGFPPIPGGLPPLPGPIPGLPDVDCFNVLAQVCSDENKELCDQCTNSLSFILNNAGCTDADYEEYCGNGMKCEDALSKQYQCTGTGATPESCYECAQKNGQALMAVGCTQDIIVSECDAMTRPPQPDGACAAAQQEACGKLAGQGDFCIDCIESRQNLYSLMRAGCDPYSNEEFCYGSAPSIGCEEALDSVCGEVFQAGSDCFHCLAANQDTIKQAKCENAQLSDFCAPKHVPQVEPPPPQGCTDQLTKDCGDQKGNQVTCLRCVSSDFEQLMRLGCTKEEVIGFCQG